MPRNHGSVKVTATPKPRVCASGTSGAAFSSQHAGVAPSLCSFGAQLSREGSAVCDCQPCSAGRGLPGAAPPGSRGRHHLQRLLHVGETGEHADPVCPEGRGCQLSDETLGVQASSWGRGPGRQCGQPPYSCPMLCWTPPCASLGGPDPGAHCSPALRLRVFPTNALSHCPCVVPPRGKQRCSLIPPPTLCVCDCPRSRQEGPRPRVTDSRLYLPQPICT